MITLQDALNAWGRPDFEVVFKKSIAALDSESLPLQQGISSGSYALDDVIEPIILHAEERPGSIEVKAQIFYTSRTPGCACAGDPTVESEQTEQCLLMIRIDKTTAGASFTLLEE